jgi:predicted ABC-type ATPase
MPDLIVLAGPNGSGKTTLSAYLVQKGRIKTPIINPDEIAINEFGSYSNQTKASRVALQRRSEALEQQADFAFETTFSGRTEIETIIIAKAKGYKITLYYVALSDVMDNLTRVEERRLKLGHHVSKEDIIRRYAKSQGNLVKQINQFDKVYIFDNSGKQYSRVAIFDNGNLVWLNNKHKDHPFYKGLF